MNILIIEDDVYLAGKISEVFKKNILTNRVKVLHTYVEFVDELYNIDAYDIILTDIILDNSHHKTGLDILKSIRQKNLEVPIVIISSISTYESLENAFSIGANDYIIKPFRLRELQIRVNKWFHDYIFTLYISLNKHISYHELIYDIAKNQYFFQGKYIDLSKSSKYLLSLFLIHAEKLLAEKFLIDKIWGDNDTDELGRNTRISVLRLKEKLRPFGIDSRISNVRGEGYIFEKN